MMASLDAVRRESVGIIGAGAAGLVTAHTLLQDGFENVQLLTRDKSVGGVWERQRIYPGLSLNNVHGEFCFSSLPMPPPQNQKRLGGEDMRAHMETFADTFLAGQIRFDEVLNIHRATGSGWEIEVQDLRTKVKQILAYDRIVLCTGGCSEPFIPESLSPDAAVKASFHGLVCHSAEFARHLDRILEDHKAIPDYSVLMVGGGKSAQDMSALSTRFGVKVTIVFEKTHAFLAYPIELPAILRKSRFLSIMASHIELRTRLERFLHTTWLGGKITRVFWDFLAWFSDNRNSTNPSTYPENSPLRSSHSLFWGILTNEEGVWKTDGFYALCNEGKIKLIAPARVVKYAGNGELVLLSNGTEIKVNAVLLATGFGSSWTNIFAQETAKELGIGRHPPLTDVEEHVWDYTSFSNPPTSHPRSEVWVSSIYRGIVPARNINHRDFAINGALSTTNNGYAFEVMAHWISSYFLGDKMRLPSSPEEATKLAGKNAAWMRRRFPGMPVCVNQSNNSEVAFWSCPQAMDDLLEDMGVPIMRSGGNWLTWPFKVITPAEIKNLREERRAKREMDLKAVN